MKIVEIEFVNHVILNTFKIKLNSSIITICGKNGSGKSFLLSSLHPFPTSSRYSKAYPIKQGETGFKRLVYDINGKIIEVMHEYVPKKNTHACKSYINRYINGIKEELNPTGHMDFFKEHVERELGFRSSIFDIGMISFKSNGLTSSAPSQRRSILESTIDMSIINRLKKNVKDIYNENNAMVKVLDNRRIDLLRNANLDKDIINHTERISNLKTEIDKLRHEIIPTLENEYNALGALDISFLELCVKYRPITQKYGLKCLNELIERRRDIDNEINRISSEISKLEKVRIDAINIKSLIESKNDAEKKLQKELEKSNNYKNILSKYISDGYDINSCNTTLSQINSLSNNLSYLNSKIPCPVDEYKSKLSDELDQLNKDIAEFDKYYSMWDGKDYDTNYSENCNSCELYNKFYMSSMYVKKHESTIEYKRHRRDEVSNDLRILNSIKMNDINVDCFTETIRDRFGLSSLDDFISKSNMNNSIAIDSFMTKLNDTYYEYTASTNDILRYKTIIESTIIPESMPLLEDVDRDLNSYRSKLNELNTQSREYDVYDLNNVKHEYLYRTDIEVDDSYISNLSHKKSDLQSKISEAKRTISDNESRIETLRYELVNFERDKKDLEETSKELSKFLRETDVFKKCRTIIDRIPIQLMEDIIVSTETIVNNILKENDIPIEISILVDGNDINIPAKVNGREVPDISCLSAGETCIISLLLNSCILNMTGYGVLCLDEIDANLDDDRRRKFNNIISSVMSYLHVTQICCISHNIATDISSATTIQIGEFSTNTNKNTIYI